MKLRWRCKKCGKMYNHPAQVSDRICRCTKGPEYYQEAADFYRHLYFTEIYKSEAKQ